MHLKVLSVKCWPFCPEADEVIGRKEYHIVKNLVFVWEWGLASCVGEVSPSLTQ